MSSTWSGGVRMVAAFAAGLLAWVAIAALWEVAATADAPVLWWLGRAAGLVAYLALAASMLFGALVSSKGAGGLAHRAGVFELHQQWTLAAVVATVLHVLPTVADAEWGVGPLAALVPFAATSLTGPVALGTIALWGLAIIAASSWLRQYVPYRAWRAIHAISFGVFLLALAHGITAGPDTTLPWVREGYIVTAALVCGAVVMRAGLALAGPRKRRSARVDAGRGAR